MKLDKSRTVESRANERKAAFPKAVSGFGREKSDDDPIAAENLTRFQFLKASAETEHVSNS